ncbi:MAG: uncharacterized protein QOE66_145, partial [Chloroflexota bacterium]|nr:uncharacterized protein [Chloroflexota bacterium]
GPELSGVDDDDGPPPGPEPTPIEERRERSQRQGRRRSRPGGGGPRRPVGGPEDGAGDGRPRMGPRIGLLVVVAVIGVVLLLGGTIVGFITDAIWFRSVSFETVFWTRVGTQAGLFVGTFVVGLLLLLGGLLIADRAVPRGSGTGISGIGSFFERLADAAREAEEGTRSGRRSTMRGSYPGPYSDRADGPSSPGASSGRPPFGTGGVALGTDDMPDLTPLARIGLTILAIVIALGIAGSVAGQWETIQLWIHRVPFAPAGAPPAMDPIFGRDISFFLFELPFYRLVQSVVTGLLLGGVILAGGRYLVALLNGPFELTTRIRVHLAVLVGVILIVIAVGYQLDKLELVYSTRGVATGVSYTDRNAQFIAFDALTIITALVGAFLVGAAFTRWVWPLGLAVVAWLAASFILGTVYPSLVQSLTVVPNQLAQEQPYILNNINMTRLAFGLDDWVPKPFKGDAPLTAAAVAQESATFKNARLWDYRPLGDTLDQLQTIRQYYNFTDVDTDRYTINGELRQVMLSAREIAPNNTAATSWVNQRITFTHGYGVAMVPVNQATPGGQPDLIIRDLPPVSTTGAPAITEPRIYFGEAASGYVVVDAKQPAFDYPNGADPSGVNGQDAPPWTGTSGIKLDTTLSRLLFALRFGDLNLLISDQVTSDSQLLFRRSLDDRLNTIAPFLHYDKDPYLVISNGKLYYIQDAYTISDRFPNAQGFDGSSLPAGSGLAHDSFNYIRNSVKIVQDAYDGTLTFYDADPADPIVRAYEGVFPGMFHPLTEMPADLQTHLRVPEELFDVQTRQYATYHITDPGTLFYKSDVWTVPSSSGSDQGLPPEAYYVVMRLPDAPDPEFLLLQPMVPASRPNMIAWVAARNDGAQRGTELVYQFPQDTTVLGPNQIEARIDADPTISAQISLWNQSGSKVIKGNLIVIPLQDSIIYLQPIYLQSTNSKFPQLEKVVLASSTVVVWGDTLQQSINLLLAGGFGGSPGTSPGPTPTPVPGASPTPIPSATPVPGLPSDVTGLVAYANTHFELAQAALRAGDFATYGREIGLVQQALRNLELLTGGSPAPSAAPTAPSTPSQSPGPS